MSSWRQSEFGQSFGFDLDRLTAFLWYTGEFLGQYHASGCCHCRVFWQAGTPNPYILKKIFSSTILLWYPRSIKYLLRHKEKPQVSFITYCTRCMFSWVIVKLEFMKQNWWATWKKLIATWYMVISISGHYTCLHFNWLNEGNFSEYTYLGNLSHRMIDV